LVVDDLADTDLGDLDAARQAWTGVAVQDCVFADTITARFKQSVFFGVEAETSGEANAAFGSVITTGAYKSISIMTTGRNIEDEQPPSLQFVMPRGVPL